MKVDLHARVEALREALQPVGCCMGQAAMDRCTCWSTVYDLEQAPLQDGPVKVREAGLCGSCAYRASSPEKRGVEGHHTEDDLVELGLGGGLFFCHQGMRRAVAEVHPEGARREMGAEDYAPPIRGAVAFRADGSPADLCAGWAAHVRAAGLDPLELLERAKAARRSG